MNSVCDHTFLIQAAPLVVCDEPKRILVVDDDSFVCGLVAATLGDAVIRSKLPRTVKPLGGARWAAATTCW